MPESSEERKLEISEKITHKFSKVRITSLHNLEKDEQGNHKDASITMRNVKDVYVQQEQLEHRGYHIVGTEEKEWELLNPQNLAGNTAHNGNGHGHRHDITTELHEAHSGPAAEVPLVCSVTGWHG